MINLESRIIMDLNLYSIEYMETSHSCIYLFERQQNNGLVKKDAYKLMLYCTLSEHEF